MLRKILSGALSFLGVILTGWSIQGIANSGFFIAGRGSTGQLDGGLFPLFLLIGILMAIYGIIEVRQNW